MKTYTSESILSMSDLYDLQDSFCGSGIHFQYEPTKGEVEWAYFIRGKYLIADWFFDNFNDGKLVFKSYSDLAEAIEGDGMPPKAIMLSDDTALQRLFFYLS